MEYLQTEHGVFTNNEVTGQSAQEVYNEWLANKDKPQEQTMEEIIMLAIAELDTQREADKTETELAIAELAETILGGTV